jgi:alpha-methylacyl-CoA racemase
MIDGSSVILLGVAGSSRTRAAGGGVMSNERGETMGPLTGIKVVEFAGIGPGPMAAMLLADLGADVLKLDRPAPSEATTGDASRFDLLSRGRKSVSIDLKHPCGLEAALQLVKMADVLIEGFRPGTMERLKLGPMEALSINPKLVYGRMTG